MKSKANLFMLAAIVGAVSTTAFAAPGPMPVAIYDNILDGSEGIDFYLGGGNSPTVHDDLHAVGGGDLIGIRFSYGTEYFGGPVTGDALVQLYLDDGATSPGVLDTSEDTQLVSESVRGIVATPGNFGAFRSEEHLIAFDTPAANIPANATLWASLTLSPTTSGTLRPVFHAPIGIGSSDILIYDDLNATTFDTVANGLPANAGLGFELFVTPEPASLSLLALAGLAMIRRRR
jgi:hypothetical protein